MKRKALYLTVFAAIFFTSSLQAQQYTEINNKYTCVRFVNGSSSLLLNGDTPGSYSMIDSGKALKEIRSERRALNNRVTSLKEIKKRIKNGDFDKKSGNIIKDLLSKYFPGEQLSKERAERLAATEKLIQKLKSEISLLKAVDLAISQCSTGEPQGNIPAKYGVSIPVSVKPVIVRGDPKYGGREAYVGMLLSVIQDRSINLKDGRKVGKRLGYLACAKNLSTGATYYRIFDDQPCEEAEGGITGGNSSLPFADLDACKALVPGNHWASFGVWSAVGNYPSEEMIQSAYVNMVANTLPFFKIVAYNADPEGIGKVSLDKFKSWCSSGNAF